jgi:SAM-dependent methyltransferase
MPDDLRTLYGPDYVAAYHKLPSHRRLTALVARCALAPSDRVVDLGCGPGGLAEAIHSRIAEYQGVDFSPPFIEEARRRAQANQLGNVSFECAGLAEFCLRNPARFDKGFMFDVNHFIPDAELLAIYAAARTALKTGGRFYLHTLNAAYFLEKLKDFKLLRRSEHYVGVRTMDENRSLLEKAGFARVRITGIAHYQAPLSTLHFLSRLPFLSRLMTARLFIEAG